MALFTKKIGPIFLKETSSAEDYINKLEKLSTEAEGELKDKIEKQIAISKYGIAGESNVAFELKNSGLDMYVLHDVYFEYEGLSAQIDYLVVTRKRIYVIECKNLIGNIEVDNGGNFIRSYELFGKKIKEGIYSPITQNERHLQVVRNIRKETKTNIITKMLFERWFDDSYKSLIVLANPKTILNAKYAKKEIKEQIVRADQLISKIKEMDSLYKGDDYSEKDMLNLANFYLSKNQSDRSDYTKKYEELLADMNANAVVQVDIKCDKGTNGVIVEKELDEEVISESNDEELLIAELKAYRLEQCKKEKIKPYYIFNDSQMSDLISKKPRTKEELLDVSGFGNAKVEKYGDAILSILAR